MSDSKKNKTSLTDIALTAASLGASYLEGEAEHMSRNPRVSYEYRNQYADMADGFSSVNSFIADYRDYLARKSGDYEDKFINDAFFEGDDDNYYDPILEFYEESEYDYALSEAKLSIIRKGVKVNDSQFEYTIGGNTLSIDMYHLIYGKVQGLLLQKKKYLKKMKECLDRLSPLSEWIDAEERKKYAWFEYTFFDPIDDVIAFFAPQWGKEYHFDDYELGDAFNYEREVIANKRFYKSKELLCSLLLKPGVYRYNQGLDSLKNELSMEVNENRKDRIELRIENFEFEWHNKGCTRLLPENSLRFLSEFKSFFISCVNEIPHILASIGAIDYKAYEEMSQNNESYLNSIASLNSGNVLSQRERLDIYAESLRRNPACLKIYYLLLEYSGDIDGEIQRLAEDMGIADDISSMISELFAKEFPDVLNTSDTNVEILGNTITRIDSFKSRFKGFDAKAVLDKLRSVYNSLVYKEACLYYIKRNINLQKYIQDLIKSIAFYKDNKDKIDHIKQDEIVDRVGRYEDGFFAMHTGFFKNYKNIFLLCRKQIIIYQTKIFQKSKTKKYPVSDIRRIYSNDSYMVIELNDNRSEQHLICFNGDDETFGEFCSIINDIVNSLANPVKDDGNLEMTSLQKAEKMVNSDEEQYILDELEFLLTKYPSLSFLSIVELNSIKEEIMQGNYKASNRELYMIAINALLQCRYEEKVIDPWIEKINSATLSDLILYEEQIKEDFPKDIADELINLLRSQTRASMLNMMEEHKHESVEDLILLKEKILAFDYPNEIMVGVIPQLDHYLLEAKKRDKQKNLLNELEFLFTKYQSLSFLSISELNNIKAEIMQGNYQAPNRELYITAINALLQCRYEETIDFWKEKINSATLSDLTVYKEQIKISNYPDKINELLLQSIKDRNDYLVKQELLDQIENVRYGSYDELKQLEENYTNVDLSKKAKDEVKIRLVNYIRDEEKRLLEEMCSTLSDSSIEELKNVKRLIIESDYDKENKAHYIEKVDVFLFKHYKERELYWSGIIRSADLDQLDEIQEQIHREGLPKDITENMMSLICNQRNSLIHTLLLYTVEKLRYSPLDILKLFREEIIEYDLKDDVLGDILERTDNYILDSKRRLLAEKYGNISAMDINELKAAEKELVEADYEADIAIPYLKRIRDSIDMRNIGYLDSLTSDLGNYDEDKLKELSAIIQQFDCKDEIKVRYTSIISNQIHSRRIDKIKVDVDRADQLSFDELNSLIALIGEVDIDESLRQDCIAKVKPWLHWAQKSFVDEQLSTLSTMNRMEITKTDELLTAAEIPDFIMECGNKRIKERLLALDTKRINTLVPDFNVLTNRDVEDLKQQLSEMDLEEESKSSVIEKLEKRKWYNSLANIIMAADRFNQLTSGLNAHNLHVALYSSTYISMLDYYKTQGRISNSDEIPIFMIDGATSVAMSKSMLWIYNAGKLFSEYLYNIIAIQITSKLFSYDLIVSLTNGSSVSFSVQNGFPKKAVLAINTLIYELKQGKYASPIYPYEFTIQPFTLPAKEQHNAAVDLDYFVERFVEKDYSGIVLIDFGIAVKCCKQRDWSETERWLTETLGINSALKVIWYVDLSRFLNGREGFAVGIDYLYLQKQNQPLIIIPISEIRNLDINNNSLYISTMENTTYRVDFRGTNEALTIFRSSLEEFIDGIRMLQAKGMIENPQIPVNELNVGIEPQMTQEDGFGIRFNRFVGGFSKKTGTFTMSSFEKNVPQQERVESESAYVEPYNDTTVGDPFTQNIQFQSEQNREPIKAGRAFTDNRNGYTYDSNIGLEQQRFCYNCGKPITGDYVFCSYCGVKLK